MTITSVGNAGGKSRKKRKSSVQVDTGEIVNNFLVLLLFTVPITMIFVASLCRVHFTAKTQNLNKTAEKMQSDIHAYEREVKNYNVRIERSCGRNIISKVKELELGLNYPRPGQIKRLSHPAEPKIIIEVPEPKKEISLR